MKNIRESTYTSYIGADSSAKKKRPFDYGASVLEHHRIDEDRNFHKYENIDMCKRKAVVANMAQVIKDNLAFSTGNLEFRY